MAIEVYILNSFAKIQTGGNPAGVVLNSILSETQMLAIAREVGFSETAFLDKIDKNSYSIRFFTPCAEVDLCGHATIAAFSLLKIKDLIQEGVYNLATKAGNIKITITNDNIFMTQKLPEFSDNVNKNEVLSCFNINDIDLIDKLPIQVVSTGLRDIFVPIKTLEILLNMKPNFEKIAELSKKHNTIGIHAFTLETMFGSTAHCRNFAPLYDIPEESATGTSSGALSCYLYKYGTITEKNSKKLNYEQGYSMKASSEIFANLSIENGKINSVNVGGMALLSKIITISNRLF